MAKLTPDVSPGSMLSGGRETDLLHHHHHRHHHSHEHRMMPSAADVHAGNLRRPKHTEAEGEQAMRGLETKIGTYAQNKTPLKKRPLG